MNPRLRKGQLGEIGLEAWSATTGEISLELRSGGQRESWLGGGLVRSATWWDWQQM